jgi:hypothetical protein
VEDAAQLLFLCGLALNCRPSPRTRGCVRKNARPPRLTSLPLPKPAPPAPLPPKSAVVHIPPILLTLSLSSLARCISKALLARWRALPSASGDLSQGTCSPPAPRLHPCRGRWHRGQQQGKRQVRQPLLPLSPELPLMLYELAESGDLC